jgi:hypothetical protein
MKLRAKKNRESGRVKDRHNMEKENSSKQKEAMANTFYFYWGINRQSREIGFKRICWREESQEQ